MKAPADLMGQSFVHSAKAVNVSLKKASFSKYLGSPAWLLMMLAIKVVLGKFLAKTDWEMIKYDFRGRI